MLEAICQALDILLEDFLRRWQIQEHHARTVGVPLMTADQVRRMQWGEAVLLAGKERPVRLSQS